VTEAPPAPTTGSIKVTLFNDQNQDGKQESTDANLTGLKVTLEDTLGNPLNSLTSVCEDNVFSDLQPGTYTVVAEQADGYSCNCETTVLVKAGDEANIDFLYLNARRA